MTDFNEKQLEELLMKQLPETPLAGKVEKINPFGAAVNKIITGMVLSTITLNFLYLNYILPTVGIMLIYLGMRTLRSGNLYFRLGWLAALGKLGFTTLHLLLQVTPYVSLVDGWGIWAGQAVHILFMLFFGLGIRQAGLDAGMDNPKMATWPVILWQLVLVILALNGLSGWTVIIILLYAWIKMVKNIYHCADDLAEAGYVVPASTVWFSAKPLMIAYFAILLAVMTGASLLVHYTPVDAQKVALTEVIGADAEAMEIRSDLAAKGFPEELLMQIADEDLADIGSVAAVSADSEKQNETDASRISGESVSVLTEEGKIKTFVWFEYMEGKHAGLVDSVKLQYDEYQKHTEVKSRLFYEKKGETWSAKLQLMEDSNTYLWFGDISTNVYSMTKYSFPFMADNPRGYFTWWTENEDGSPVYWSLHNAVFNCLRTPLVLPYVELPENAGGVVLFGGFGSGLGQEKFQIYANPGFDLQLGGQSDESLGEQSDEGVSS